MCAPLFERLPRESPRSLNPLDVLVLLGFYPRAQPWENPRRRTARTAKRLGVWEETIGFVGFSRWLVRTTARKGDDSLLLTFSNGIGDWRLV
jgi:hypothetical protein